MRPSANILRLRRLSTAGAALMIVLLTMEAPAAAAGALPSAVERIPPLTVGDEPIVVTRHTVRTSSGVLKYEARAGRIAIRTDEASDARGYIFFVAYALKDPKAGKRPLLFAWNGGPGASSELVHTLLFGPRLLQEDHFVDNPDTALEAADLVFVDAMGTGFSRLGKPEYAKDFYGVTSDMAATAEFIRNYRALAGVQEQPLFLAGESLGTWRASGVAEMLEKNGTSVAGLVLLSGQVPGAQISYPFDDAFYIPARTEAAFAMKRLAPELMADLPATRRKVLEWVKNIYWPALERIGSLSAAEREKLAQELAYYTGIPADQVYRKTLVMTNTTFRKDFLGGDRELNRNDLTFVGPYPVTPGHVRAMQDYLRIELGYATGLSYTSSIEPIERSFLSIASGYRGVSSEGWAWDHARLGPYDLQRFEVDGTAPTGAQPWLQNAMKLDARMRVFIAAGRVDSMVSCSGNTVMIERLGEALARRITDRCYDGGHMMYRVEATRVALLSDVKRFLRTRAPD